jgi:hypothetical protein
LVVRDRSAHNLCGSKGVTLRNKAFAKLASWWLPIDRSSSAELGHEAILVAQFWVVCCIL